MTLDELLRSLADRYETARFLDGDPSWFMHQVQGRANQEVMAFLASVLAYGRRDQFIGKAARLLAWSDGEPWQWVREGAYRERLADADACFYRLYTQGMMSQMLDALRDMLVEWGSVGAFVEAHCPSHAAVEALLALSGFFRARGVKGMVPSPQSSVAKRPCMLLRWMVRDGSPVDLGLWADIIDKSTLYVPLDTHVLQVSRSLGLLVGRTAGWRAVERLTAAMGEVFPGDPARGDFALFGYGVDPEAAGLQEKSVK